MPAGKEVNDGKWNYEHALPGYLAPDSSQPNEHVVIYYSLKLDIRKKVSRRNREAFGLKCYNPGG